MKSTELKLLSPARVGHFHLSHRVVMAPLTRVRSAADDIPGDLMVEYYAAGGFTAQSAEAVIEDGDADLVAFGRDFVANPDLPYRLRHNLALIAYQRDTFYGGDHRGYIDYPFATAEVSAA